MSDGSLSQDEIDALLQGTDNIDMDAGGAPAPAATAVGTLSDEEKDTLQDILKGVVESEGSNLSMLTGKTVRIEPPTVEIVPPEEAVADLPEELVEVKNNFSDGIQGEHSYFFSSETAVQVAGLMLGQEGVELDDMAISTLGEAVSNISEPLTTALSNRLNANVQNEAPSAAKIDKAGISLPPGEAVVKVTYPFTVEGEMPAQLVEFFSLDVIKQMTGGDSAKGESIPGNSVPAAEAVNPAAPQSPGQDMGDLFGGGDISGGQPQGFDQTVQYMGGGTAPNVQPVQFANLQPTNISSEQGNLGLLMDVFMEMTVELGRTKKLIKEILTFGEGTIIELDKLAGEPVDILVNHKLIAKGEVVVIDENFGVRVTEIVSPMERMGDLA